ncbi:MAG TPA: LacI family DNA-binding transcriptional regulator [Terriglobales bacterium]
MAVTMQDIARDLKVSVVTVSKALRHQGSISIATRNRVLQRAKELNYQMNWVARSLVTRRTYTIGLLLPDVRHPFFAEIAKAVAETVRPRGYHVVISYFEEDPELEAIEAESLVARQVDGLIVASAQSPESDLFRRIRERKVPFVLIDRPIVGSHVSFVGTDNEAIGRLATEHLIAQGCQRIAHLRGPEIGIATARMTGYRKALVKHKLSMPAEYIVDARYDDDMGYRAMRTLLGRDPLPDGVFCYNDPVAIGAMKAILEAGFKVGPDIAVIGAGNVRYSDVLAVPLTTVDQGTVHIGTQASEILIQQISSKRALRPKTILIAPKLVIRKSTAR